MLDAIRKNRKTFVGVLIAAFCAVMMVGFGVDTYHTAQRQKPVATINGEDISYREYLNEYERISSRLRAQLGENFGLVQEQLNLKQQTIDFIINNRLFREYTKKLGLTASVPQIEEQIRSYPYFSGGNFTKAAYDGFLRATGMTGAQLEAAAGEEIVRGQLTSLFRDLSAPSDAELRGQFIDQNTTIKLNTLLIKASDFVSQVDANDGALKEYFEKNSERYRTQKQVSFSYLEFPAPTFMSNVDVTDDDLQEYYRQHQPDFTEPKKVKLRQIFFAVKPKEENALPFSQTKKKEEATQSEISEKEVKRAKAEEVLKKLQDGAKFEDLVSQYSEDKTTRDQGGDMGGLLAPESIFPEIRDGIARLLEGENSGIIESKLGLHIVHVDEIQNSSLKPFETVRSEVEQKFRDREAPLYARVEAENASAQLSDGALTLQGLAEARQLPLKSTSAPVSPGNPGNAPQALVAKAIEMNQGDREVIAADGIVYLLEVTAVQDPTVPAFDTVRERVTKEYTEEKARELARTTATDVLSQLKEKLKESQSDEDALKRSSALFGAIANERRLVYQVSAPGTKKSAAGEPFTVPGVSQQAFNLSVLNPIADKVFETPGTFYIIGLNEQTLPSEETFPAKKSELRQAHDQLANQRIFDTILDSLKAESEIWINPDFLAEAG